MQFNTKNTVIFSNLSTSTAVKGNGIARGMAVPPVPLRANHIKRKIKLSGGRFCSFSTYLKQSSYIEECADLIQV